MTMELLQEHDAVAAAPVVDPAAPAPALRTRLRWLQEVGDDQAEPVRVRWVALSFICLAIFISTVDLTIANTALPTIGDDLGASTSELQWVMDAFNLALAGFVLFGGGLADRYGRKGVFMAGFALFGVASVAASMSTTVETLIASRAAMGLGAALIYPPALSMLSVLFRPAERGRAIAWWAATGTTGIALGPVLAGLLLDRFWWGSVFLVGAPVAVIGLIGAALAIPTSRRHDSPRPDRIGAALSVLGLGGVVYGIIEAPARGWDSVPVLLALLVGVTCLVAFIRWELHLPHPMVDPRVLRRGRVLAGSLVLIVAYFTMTGTLFVVPQYLEYVLDDTNLATGLYLLPLGLFAVPMTIYSARVSEWMGTQRTLLLGLAFTSFGCVLVAVVDELPGYWIVGVGMAFMAVGGGLAVPNATKEVINTLPTSRAGDASAVNQVMRQLGAVLGVAILGSVLAATYAGGMDLTEETLSDDQQVEAAATIDGATDVAAEIDDDEAATLLVGADSAFRSAVQWTMLLAALVAAAAAVVAWRAGRGPEPPAGAELTRGVETERQAETEPSVPVGVDK